MIDKIIPIISVFLAISIIYYLIIFMLKKSKKFDNDHLPEVKRALNFIMVLILIVSITIIIGVDFDNIWASIISVLAVIAIALFAVWSILSNIIAGILIHMTRPFKLKDWVEIHPELIKGKVKIIGMMFITIEDDEKNIFKIPNNLIFQKYTKIFKKKPVPVEEVKQEKNK